MATAKAKKPKMLSIKRKLERETGALHTSVGRVNQEPVAVPAEEAQGYIDSGMALLVGEAPEPDDDDAAGPDAPATT